jgi:hypothetical protein
LVQETQTGKGPDLLPILDREMLAEYPASLAWGHLGEGGSGVNERIALHTDQPLLYTTVTHRATSCGSGSGVLAAPPEHL